MSSRRPIRSGPWCAASFALAAASAPPSRRAGLVQPHSHASITPAVVGFDQVHPVASSFSCGVELYRVASAVQPGRPRVGAATVTLLLLIALNLLNYIDRYILP